MQLIKEISFRPTQNKFQPKLKKDTRKRNSTLKILYTPIQQQLFKVTKDTLWEFNAQYKHYFLQQSKKQNPE